MQLNVEDEYLTGGELACFMSHVSIWQKMVDEQLPYVAIFEDDVFLGERAFEIFNSSSWIQEEWHTIKTEAFSEKVLLAKEVYRINDTNRPDCSFNWKKFRNSGIYIIT